MARREYFEHISAPGERWDTIAVAYYGRVEDMRLLIEANADLFAQGFLPIFPILPPRTILRVPVVEPPAMDETLLPPWKRS